MCTDLDDCLRNQNRVEMRQVIASNRGVFEKVLGKDLMNGNCDLIMGGREAITCKGKGRARVKTLRQKQAWHIEGNINGVPCHILTQ